MLSHLTSACLYGIEACLVDVEVDLSNGLPTVIVVGLPDAAVRESRDRVKAAIQNSEFDFPLQRITVNLSPGDLKKEGPLFDLPIALGLLAASGRANAERLAGYVVLGELGLDGAVQSMHGLLPIAIGLKRLGRSKLLIPAHNAAEAAIVPGIEAHPVRHLREAVAFLNGEADIPQHRTVVDGAHSKQGHEALDFSDVKGQQHVKRALEVACAGEHNVLMIGPPGTGKTMLAKRIPTILPGMTEAEALETAAVHSAVGLLPPGRTLCIERPFRAPHHTASAIALIGGGSNPKPGEISLAHHGVLFLDELPEFRRDVLEVLRQPLEDGVVTIARASRSVTFPTRFLMVSSMNPCLCGFLSDASRPCRCGTVQIERYRAKVSGPLLDRIDVHVEVPALQPHELSDGPPAESSATIRERVNAARTRQHARFAGTSITTNAQMSHKQLRVYCQLTADGKTLLRAAMKELHLSARAHDRILKLSRTIADLSDAETIHENHVAEAIQYRTLDRQMWG